MAVVKKKQSLPRQTYKCKVRRQKYYKDKKESINRIINTLANQITSKTQHIHESAYFVENIENAIPTDYHLHPSSFRKIKNKYLPKSTSTKSGSIQKQDQTTVRVMFDYLNIMIYILLILILLIGCIHMMFLLMSSEYFLLHPTCRR